MIHRRLSAGFSLIEVLLAISIFTASLLALGQLITMGRRQLQRDEELSTAQALADSLMNGLATGVHPVAPTSWTPFVREPEWNYAIEVSELEWDRLIQIQVHVAPVVKESVPTTGASLPRPTFTLIRWLRATQLAQTSEGQQDTESSTEGSTQFRPASRSELP